MRVSTIVRLGSGRAADAPRPLDVFGRGDDAVSATGTPPAGRFLRRRPGWDGVARSTRGSLPTGERPELWRRNPAATAEVEVVAGRQRMEHDAADHQRPMAADLPGIRLGVRAI